MLLLQGLFLVLAALVSQVVHLGEALERAKLEVTLLRYSNPNNMARNGNCCEGTSVVTQFGLCAVTQACDPIFSVTIKKSTELLRVVQSPKFRRTSNLNLATVALGFPNPLVQQFSIWDTQVEHSVKIQVYDQDSATADDEILTVTKTVRGDVGSSRIYTSDNGHGGSIRYKIRTYCSENWYERDCSVACVAGPSSTYTCHNTTGQKICNPGFSGLNCETEDRCITNHINCSFHGACHDEGWRMRCVCNPGYEGAYCEVRDFCYNETCNNNGVCVQAGNGYSCTCTRGYAGRDCQNNIDDCATRPCARGTCHDELNDYRCVCPSGWTGRNCDVNIDDCDGGSFRSPCVHGTCQDKVNGYECVCDAGYSGDRCQENVDECASNPCYNNGRCVDSINDYTCVCPPRYSGRRCQTQIDFCSNHPCSGQGTCQNRPNGPGFLCQCENGYSGETCSTHTCSLSPCLHGTCAPSQNAPLGFTCSCQPGFTGSTCDIDINSCTLDACEHGNCEDRPVGHVCNCNPGYTGSRCQVNIDDCASNPCVTGTCSDLVNDFLCSCQAGFTGRLCGLNIDECSDTNVCGHGTCTDTLGSYTCDCFLDYTGTHCETKIDDCNGVDCNYGNCRDGSGIYTCQCHEGFTGQHCDTQIDLCSQDPCVNGDCINQFNNYTCRCELGFVGKDCDEDLDECPTVDCGFGRCRNTYGSFECVCEPGYAGPNCQVDIDECELAPCVHGTCIDQVHGFSCSCVDHFTGDLCENQVDYCQSNPCDSKGNCTNTGTGYKCSCNDEWIGQTCGTKRDCYNSGEPTCLNSGHCYYADAIYQCDCSLGFYGRRCDIERKLINSSTMSYIIANLSQFKDVNPGKCTNRNLVQLCVNEVDFNTESFSLTLEDSYLDEMPWLSRQWCQWSDNATRCVNDSSNFKNLSQCLNMENYYCAIPSADSRQFGTIDDKESEITMTGFLRTYWYLLVITVAALILMIGVSIKCHMKRHAKKLNRSLDQGLHRPNIPRLPIPDENDHIYEGVKCLNVAFDPPTTSCYSPDGDSNCSGSHNDKRPDPQGCSYSNIYDEPRKLCMGKQFMVPLENQYSYPSLVPKPYAAAAPSNKSEERVKESPYYYTDDHIYAVPLTIQRRCNPLYADTSKRETYGEYSLVDEE